MTVKLRFYDTVLARAAPCVSWSPAGQGFAFRRGLRATHGNPVPVWSDRDIRRRRLCRGWHRAGACACSATSGGTWPHVCNRGRFPRVPWVPARLGYPEFLLDRAVAAAGAVERAVAHLGRGADPAVALQARRGADDREFRRPDGDRPGYDGLPVH